jgi:anthranilate phosphoribosyltransferase
VLNAGAALYVGGKAASFADGVKAAEAAVESRAGLEALERLRGATRG